LICKQQIAVPKEYNVRGYYGADHTHMGVGRGGRGARPSLEFKI